MNLVSRTVPVLLLATAIVACESKDAAVVDAGPVPSVAVPVPSTPASAEMAALEQPAAVEPAAGAAAAAAAGGTAAKGATAADASAAGAVADAGAVQECCCEASGFALQSVGMSECSKTRKGQCVSKTKCTGTAPAASAAAPAAPAASAASAGQTCCCDAAGTKSVTGMSACTKGGKGKCVKASECK